MLEGCNDMADQACDVQSRFRNGEIEVAASVSSGGIGLA